MERTHRRLAARMGADLKREGRPIPEVDLFVAASAIIWGDGEIVTRDAEHFQRLRRYGVAILPA